MIKQQFNGMVTLEDWEVYYSIDSEGKPVISDKELLNLKESLIEEITESEEFEKNVNKQLVDFDADQADYEYERIKDMNAEANWENNNGN